MTPARRARGPPGLVSPGLGETNAGPALLCPGLMWSHAGPPPLCPGLAGTDSGGPRCLSPGYPRCAAACPHVHNHSRSPLRAPLPGGRSHRGRGFPLGRPLQSGPPFCKKTATSVARRQRCGHVGRWPRRVGNRAVAAVPRHCLSLPAPPPMSPGLHGATSIPPPLSPGLHLSLPAPPPVFLAGRARAVAAAVSRVPN